MIKFDMVGGCTESGLGLGWEATKKGSILTRETPKCSTHRPFTRVEDLLFFIIYYGFVCLFVFVRAFGFWALWGNQRVRRHYLTLFGSLFFFFFLKKTIRGCD